MRTHDPLFTALFDAPQWALPSSLPDGQFSGGSAIFADGFESGDVSGWSASTP